MNECKKAGYPNIMNAIYGYPKGVPIQRAIKRMDNEESTYMMFQYLKDGYYVPEEFKRYYIPAGSWAVFHAKEEMVDVVWKRKFETKK